MLYGLHIWGQLLLGHPTTNDILEAKSFVTCNFKSSSCIPLKMRWFLKLQFDKNSIIINHKSIMILRDINLEGI
jgi:hypothetical protein